MNDNHESNFNLLSNNYLSTDDILITPDTGCVKSRSDINLDLETFIYSSPMDTVASDNLFFAMLSDNQSPVSCRFFSTPERLAQLDLFLNNPNYWFSVGGNIKDFNMLQKYFKETDSSGVNICVDVAHGDTVDMHKIYKMYSEVDWCKNLMSGTVATPFSAQNCYTFGCTHIRVGIGPGSACTTRIVTGCGVPNLSAVFNIWDHFNYQSAKPLIIADGGIRNTGDIAKYLAAGANAVMVGNLLSRTQESGGWKTSFFKLIANAFTLGIYFKNYTFKNYRGQASLQFQKDTNRKLSKAPEGIQGPQIYPQYSWTHFYEEVTSALQSTLSYTGLKALKTLNPENVSLIKVTQNGVKESKPHILS